MTNHKFTLVTARVSYAGNDRCDITIKSAVKPEEKALAPDDWNMVMGVKEGRVTWEHYSHWYRGLVYRRYLADPSPFLSLLNAGSATICCYCNCKPDDRHCHRFLAVDALRWIAGQNGIEFEYRGEFGEFDLT